MIWKSEVHDKNINDFSPHPLTCTKRNYCKWQSGSQFFWRNTTHYFAEDYTSTKWSSMFV